MNVKPTSFTTTSLNQLRLYVFLAAALASFAVPCVAQNRQAQRNDAYVDGSAAKLNRTHVRKLHSLRAPIAIPTYVPAGFRIAEVTTKRDTTTARNFTIIDYAISYHAPGGKSFSINSANEGIGDLFLSEKKLLKGTNPFFENPIEVGYLDDDTDGEPEKEIASQWVSSRKRFRVRKTPDGEQVYHLRAEGITLREALKIMESLRYLKQ
ncbi:MAG TPA: hypothetical protein VF666_11745 [Pyrinomonadaceae bacterium]|jgi:hypothetical protein